MESDPIATNAQKVAATDPKVRTLEEQRARIVRTSAPRYIRRLSLGLVGAFTLVFGVIGIIAWAAAGALPNEAGMVGGIGGLGLFIGLVIGVSQMFLTPVISKRQLEVIDRQLAEAQRIAKLESEVAAMRRVRVDAPAEEEQSSSSTPESATGRASPRGGTS